MAIAKVRGPRTLYDDLQNKYLFLKTADEKTLQAVPKNHIMFDESHSS
jgi:hypothetical protein